MGSLVPADFRTDCSVGDSGTDYFAADSDTDCSAQEAAACMDSNTVAYMDSALDCCIVVFVGTEDK